MMNNRFQYRVRFTSTGRPSRILTKYRPDWTADSKPEYNCAVLLFDDKESIGPGESHICYLEPMRPDLWEAVRLNDILKCMEGHREVGEALVLEILSV